MILRSIFVMAALVFSGVAGCQSEKPGTAYQNPMKPSQDDHADGNDHGPPLDLGSQPLDDRTVRASREEGKITAGGDAPCDIWVTRGTTKVKAVRIWIGTEDASGSVKALAAIEDAADPTHWHTHAEAPNPIPEGSKLWVEVEDEAGTKSATSFDLKM